MAKTSVEATVVDAATSSDKRQTASDFIREQGRDLPTAEVVEMGKAVGLEFTANLVSKVRRADEARGANKSGGKLRRKGGRPAKSVAPASRVRARQATEELGRKRRLEAIAIVSSEGGLKSRRGRPRKAYVKLPSTQHPTSNKSAFIRSFDVTVPAAQVVEEGKKVGLKFSPAYVYTARSNALTKQPGDEPTKGGANSMVLLASAPAPSRTTAVRGSSSKTGREQDMAYLLGLVIRVGLPRVEELVAEVKTRLEGLTERR